MKTQVACLFLFAIISGIAGNSIIEFSHEEGEYNQDLNIALNSQFDSIYYTINLGGPTRLSPLYQKPIALQAPENTRKLFLLRVLIIDDQGRRHYFQKNYIIHKIKPKSPLIVCPQGVFCEPVEIKIINKDDTQIYYTLDGSIPDINSQKYQEPFTVYPNSQPKKYLIRAVAVNAVSLSSEISKKSFILVNPVTDKPDFVGIEDKRIYGTDIIVQIKGQTKNIFFTYSDDNSMPGKPNQKSIKYKKPIRFTVNKGSMKKFILSAVQYRGLKGELPLINTIEFTINKKPPPAPEILNVKSGANYTEEKNIMLKSETGIIYYSLTKAGEKTNYKKYDLPIFISGSKNKKISYTISAFVIDSARNRSKITGPFRFSINRETLYAPQIEGISFNNVSNQNLNIKLKSNEGKVYYLFTTDGKEPDETKIPQIPLRGNIACRCNDGEEKKYWFKTYAQDEKGNRSKVVSYQFVIDKKPPQPPVITGVEPNSTNKEKLNIEIISNDLIYYLLTDRNIDPKNLDLKKMGKIYSEILPLKVPQNNIIQYYLYAMSYDLAGNNSELVSLSFSQGQQKIQPPEIVNFQGKTAVFNTVQTLLFKPSPGKIHYELSSDNKIPANISQKSMVFKNGILLNCDKGEKKRFLIRAQSLYDDGTPLSEPVLYQVIIDRQPPENIEYQGIEENYVYNEPVYVKIKSADSESLSYSLFDKNLNKFVIKNKTYMQGFYVSPPIGKETVYQLRASAIDDAGNIFHDTKGKLIYFNTKSLFVSTSNKSFGIGTRNQPFQSLNYAISQAKKLNIYQINVAQGTISLENPIHISNGMLITGGFDPKTWQLKEQNYTKLVLPVLLRKADALINFEKKAKNTGLYNIEIEHKQKNLNIMNFNQNVAELKNIKINCENQLSLKNIIECKNSRLFLMDFSIKGDLENIKDGVIFFDNSTVTMENINIKLKTMNLLSGLKIRNGSQLNIDKLTMELINKKKLYFIDSDKSHLFIKNSYLHNPDAVIDGYFFRMVNSNATVLENRIQSDNSGCFNLIICDVKNSDAIFKKNTVEIKGSTNLRLIKTQSVNFNFESNYIKIFTVKDSCTHFRLKKSYIEAGNNIFELQKALTEMNFYLENSEANIFNNTFYSQDITRQKVFFWIQGNSKSSVITNNLIYGSHDAKIAKLVYLNHNFVIRPAIIFKNNNIDRFTVYLAEIWPQKREVTDIHQMKITEPFQFVNNYTFNMAECIYLKGPRKYLPKPESPVLNLGYRVMNAANDFYGNARGILSDGFDIGAVEWIKK